jgi:hypothetical protein
VGVSDGASDDALEQPLEGLQYQGHSTVISSSIRNSNSRPSLLPAEPLNFLRIPLSADALFCGS